MNNSQSINPIASIPSAQLTNEYWVRAKEQARLERDWEIADHQRLVVLAEMTKISTESSHAAAERDARTSKTYKDFLIKRADIKEELVLARARTKALSLEINLRINKSFTDRQEYNGGKLTP